MSLSEIAVNMEPTQIGFGFSTDSVRAFVEADFHRQEVKGVQCRVLFVKSEYEKYQRRLDHERFRFGEFLTEDEVNNMFPVVLFFSKGNKDLDTLGPINIPLDIKFADAVNPSGKLKEALGKFDKHGRTNIIRDRDDFVSNLNMVDVLNVMFAVEIKTEELLIAAVEPNDTPIIHLFKQYKYFKGDKSHDELLSRAARLYKRL